MVILILMVMLFQINSETVIGNRVIYDEEFVTLIGSFDVAVEQGATSLFHTHNIPYPEGFTVNNTVVIAIGIKNNDQQLFSYSFGTLSESNASGMVSSSFGKAVILNSDNMQLKCLFDYGASHQAANYTYGYKIVLKKIDPDVSSFELGDMNMDGQVTQADLDLMHAFLLGTQTITDKQFKLGDMNGDGVINSGDSYLLARKINGQS